MSVCVTFLEMERRLHGVWILMWRTRGCLAWDGGGTGDERNLRWTSGRSDVCTLPAAFLPR